MHDIIPFLIVIVLVVLLSMLGLGLGALMKKKTPLKGSCHGVSCESQGKKGHHHGCACGNEPSR